MRAGAVTVRITLTSCLLLNARLSCSPAEHWHCRYCFSAFRTIGLKIHGCSFLDNIRAYHDSLPAVLAWIRFPFFACRIVLSDNPVRTASSRLEYFFRTSGNRYPLFPYLANVSSEKYSGSVEVPLSTSFPMR